MSNQPKNSAWTVLITDGLQESAIAILEKSAAVQNRPDISADDLMKSLAGVQAIIVRGRTKVTADVFAAAPDLKVVGRAGVGVDNIDLKAAKAKNVIVVNAPQSTTLAVAEHTLALMLSLAREIPLADSGLRRGEWLKKKLEGFELSGKTLGIVGHGPDRFVCRRARRRLWDDLRGIRSAAFQRGNRQTGSATRGFGRRSPPGRHPHPARAADTGNPRDDQRRPAAPDETGRADYLHRARKHHRRSRAAGRAGIRPHCGRGPGRVRHGTRTDTPLVKHPKVVCTPHIAAQTMEAQERAARDIAEEILTVLRGQTPRWRVA